MAKCEADECRELLLCYCWQSRGWRRTRDVGVGGRVKAEGIGQRAEGRG